MVYVDLQNVFCDKMRPNKITLKLLQIFEENLIREIFTNTGK